MTKEMPTSDISILKGDSEYLSVSHKKVLDNMPVGVIITTKEKLHIEYMNGFFMEKSGFLIGEIQNVDFTLYSLIDAKNHEMLDVQLSSNDSVVHYDVACATAGYDKYSISIRGLYDELGFHIGYQFTLSPETSHRTLPYFSSETKDLFLQHFRNFGYGTFEWSLDTNDIIWSDTVYDIYELSRNNRLTFDDVRSLHHPDDKGIASVAWAHAKATGEPFNYEIRIITPSKKMKYVSCMGKVFTNNTGKQKIIGSVREITWQKESDFSLKKHLNELNRSNKELEEFAYITSHDLQEPLRKVSTFSERLAEKAVDKLDDEGNFYLKRIMAAASNMRLLINNLLDFSRVTKGELSFTETSLDFIIREVKNDLELKISENNADIQCSGLPVIESDPFQMRQLFLNLIGNALKFKDSTRDPIIKITATELPYEDIVKRELDLSKNYYKIVVEDNGIGFEEEYATRIFQIFQRLHGKAEYPGSGIGLAICNKIVDHHHGMLYADSVFGEGAQFSIILPQKQS